MMTYLCGHCGHRSTNASPVEVVAGKVLCPQCGKGTAMKAAQVKEPSKSQPKPGLTDTVTFEDVFPWLRPGQK